MSVGIRTIHDALASIAAATGRFEKVNKHEPKNAGPSRLYASVFLGPDDLEPIEGSGLAATSVRVVFSMQVRQNMMSEPQDGIDAEIGEACDDVMSVITGNYDLNVTGVRSVDLLGAYGPGLHCGWGYVDHDNKKFRVGEIYIPIIVNDAWTQAV
jgi:hypothetical protein